MNPQHDIDDIVDGAHWLATNKGFASMVAGFGSVILTVIGTTVYMSNIIHAFDKRITINEQRLTHVETTCTENARSVRAISDEQLRRTSPVAKIEALSESVKRIEDTLQKIQ